MSNKLSSPQSTEEADLGQIFNYLEKVFKKLKDFIVSIFKFFVFILTKIGVFALICLNVVKQKYIYIILAGVLGYASSFLLDKISIPKYQSSMIINQNFNSGRVLYNIIDRYNLLARDKDSAALAKLLNIPVSQAAQIVGVEVYDNMNRIALRDRYNDYVKDVDTLPISFNAFLDEYDLENVSTQTINVYSIDPNAFNDLTEGIVSGFENNIFFKNEKEKQIEKIKSNIAIYKDMLKKSDTLQKQYIDLLKKYYGTNSLSPDKQTTLNLNLSNNKDKVETKEFQLFEEQKVLNLAITELQEELQNKKEIFSIQSGFKAPIIVSSYYKKTQKRNALILSSLVFLFFLLKRLGISNILNKYGNAEELLK